MIKRTKLATLIITLLIMTSTLLAGSLMQPARSEAKTLSGTSSTNTSSVPANSTGTTNCQSKPTFFGLLPWYQYLTLYAAKQPAQLGQPVCEVCFDVLGNQSQAGCPKSATSDISLVLLAIVDDLLRVAGMIAIVMVLYSSVKFITSQGEPDAVAQARKSIVNALIGAVIALVAVVLVSFLGNVLGG